MRRSWRRAVVLAAAVPLVLILCALLYQEGMARLEGQPRSFWAALGFVSETLTSTGYGADARWSTPAMVLFVVFLQFLGACLLALLISVYLIPSLEARFEQKLPRRRPSGLAEPVVVFRYGAAVESLIEQLEGARRSFLVVESDEQLARRLLERGVPVVFARDDDDAMEAAGLPVATALVANGRDEENVAAILRARQLGFGGSILALAEDPVRRRPMELAGASGVFTPKHMLAAALAARASGQISPRLSGIQEIGDLELREVRVELGSALAGQTLLELEERLSLQTKVIGVWLGGRLLAPPPPSTRLQAHCGLIVIGRHDPLERLTSLAEGAHPLSREGPFLIAGFGEVGRKVHQLLTDSGEAAFSIDHQACPGVDLVGNVLEVETLERAGVRRARSVVLALDSDDATLLATVIIRDQAPEVPIIARVNKARNVEHIHRAGADFALSVSQVAGQMLSNRLLRQETLTIDRRLQVLKLPGAPLVGRAPVRLGGPLCSVVAVERSGDVVVHFDADFRVRPDDTVFVCGGEEAVRQFVARHGFP